MVISVQGENGVSLRNSIPCLEMMTESEDKDKRDCRAWTVRFCGNDPPVSTLRALIQQRKNNTRPGIVNPDKRAYLSRGASGFLSNPVGVAQVPTFSNLLYRRFPACRSCDSSKPQALSPRLPIGNQRYSPAVAGEPTLHKI